jgi:hypothetical protein
MKKIIYYLFAFALIFSCSPDSTNNNNSGNSGDSNNNGNNGNDNNSVAWLIPLKEVVDGGPGKDGIPSIDTPIYIDTPEDGFLTDESLIVGVIDNGEAYAYPHYILDWHEVVNDIFANKSMTLSYCPLTGTAFGWESSSDNSYSTFGVSGLLYNANLILYDRNTDSFWSQMLLKCVNGEQIGNIPTLIDVVETNWKTWKTLYPNTKLLSSDTGIYRPYGTYPYGNYKTNHDSFLFTPSPLNSALPNKQRVFALLGRDKSKVYKFSTFQDGLAIKNSFDGKDYLIVGNENAITAFELTQNFSGLNFEFDFSNSETFFKDDEGNKWSIFGKAIEGPRKGIQLTAAKKVTSMWFAVAAFYPNPIIYTE